MSPCKRSRHAVFTTIKALSATGKPVMLKEIARASTYSITTVVRVVQELEQQGYIEVDRSARKKDRTAPYSYRILREMENTDKK